MSIPKFYNLRLCPFGQRVWMSLLYKGVEFEYVDTNPYDKSPEFLAINPRGLVPVIRHNDKNIYESAVLMEYIDETWPNDKALLPGEPYQRAHVRMWADHVSKKIVPQYYTLLLTRTVSDQDRARQAILKGVSLLIDNMSQDGPYFLGNRLSMVDIMLTPFAQGMSIIAKHYRDFDIPDDDKFKRYHTWWDTVRELSCYRQTKPSPDALINAYSFYAETSDEKADQIRDQAKSQI